MERSEKSRAQGEKGEAKKKQSVKRKGGA